VSLTFNNPTDTFVLKAAVDNGNGFFDAGDAMIRELDAKKVTIKFERTAVINTPEAQGQTHDVTFTAKAKFIANNQAAGGVNTAVSQQHAAGLPDLAISVLGPSDATSGDISIKYTNTSQQGSWTITLYNQDNPAEKVVFTILVTVEVGP
jgi:hypothetical protein